MPIVGRYFPSQKSEERVFLLLRRHWFTYVAFLFIAFIMVLPLAILIVYINLNPDIFSGIWGNIAILASSTYSLFILGLMLFGFIDYYLDVYIVTDERIVSVEQNGFFRRGISELHLHQVQDVSAKVVGFFPTIFHYGDIYIQTAGERENFIFKSIPNPYRVSKIIVDLHEAQLEQVMEAAEEVVEAKPAKKMISGKSIAEIPDEADLFSSGANSKVLSNARKRTKEFLNNEISADELKKEAEKDVLKSGELHENEIINI